MSELMELNTFYTAEAPSQIIVDENDLRELIDVIEAHGIPITWNNDLLSEKE